MVKRFFRDRTLVALFILALVIKIISFNENWVERYYTYGLYPVISKTLRAIFGWLPFSFGDLLYCAVVIYLFVKAAKLGSHIKNRSLRTYLSTRLLQKIVKIVLLIYLVFNVLWGLNYDRRGIASQLGLQVRAYSTTELSSITGLLQQRLNACALQVDSLKRAAINKNQFLFKQGIACYKNAEKHFSFLHYNYPSVKPSMFSDIGHFFGFTGYYNPFSGEAQVKTSVPVFLKPFIVTHEIGHQLGYAKENEANFVSFLACRGSANAEYRYSVYYEMYQYAARELFYRDSILAKAYKKSLQPQVLKDNQVLKEYVRRMANPIEPYISSFYDEYLRMNNQPHGKQTYDEVVGWLIAYQKKYGQEAI